MTYARVDNNYYCLLLLLCDRRQCRVYRIIINTILLSALGVLHWLYAYAGDTHPGRRRSRRPSMNTNKRPPRLRLRRCCPDRFASIRSSYPLFFASIGDAYRTLFSSTPFPPSRFAFRHRCTLLCTIRVAGLFLSTYVFK